METMTYHAVSRPRIRRGGEADIDLVNHLYRATLLCVATEDRAEAIAALGRATVVEAGHARNGGGLFVAERDGEILGGIAWRKGRRGGVDDDLVIHDGRHPFQVDPARSAIVLAFFVIPSDGAAALARRLVASAVADAGRNGCSRAVTLVHPAAAMMHSAGGFAVERVLRWSDGAAAPISLLQMQKRIEPSVAVAA
ncbi:hypothetical protein [Propylenella binzhouense]|uniref:N-acetyltransferase domain-containing protein n=1 Tax=Propylenella binzhouense TaxID=2555902 RepID=A0A964T600_9HYPH|nr:hypothetical protein [Propylenella binzhouense]MYZ48527.1 hypothetical protein [Propylenella binzhouense]